MAASIGCSFSGGRFFATKPLSQKHRSTFLPLQDANPTPSFGGFGLKSIFSTTILTWSLLLCPICARSVHMVDGGGGFAVELVGCWSWLGYSSMARY